MPKATAIFSHLVQDSQDYGSDADHMVSRAFFELQLEGRTFPDLYVDIKQTVGSDINADPLEVSPVRNYDGPMNYEAIRGATERYFRGLVGAGGAGIRIGGNVRNIRMQNNLFQSRAVFEFDVTKENPAW